MLKESLGVVGLHSVMERIHCLHLDRCRAKIWGEGSPGLSHV